MCIRDRLCTGRNLKETRVFDSQLEAPADWAVIANGAAVERVADGRQIAFDGLDRRMCETVLAVCAQFATDPCLYTGESLYYGREFLRFLQEIRRRGRTALDETSEGYFFVDSEEKWRDLQMCIRDRTELPPKVAHYAQMMGVQPTGMTITSARTRFGSCSGKNRICFSWRLMDYPEAAVDYVVVHELAHIVHKNHGPQFWALVGQYMPDYRARRALLRE